MEYFEAQTAAFGWQLTANQLYQFARYQELLLDWNRRLNLTSIRSPRLIQQRHFLDSLSCIRVTGELNGKSLVDVGSGAGFPGIPLKLMYPDLVLTLVESVSKKARFLEAVIAELGLTQVRVESRRAEDLGHDRNHRGMYDWSVARGVATLRTLVEYLLPLCRIGGHMLAQKGKDASSEATDAMSAITELGGAHPELTPVRIPDLSNELYLVVVEKVADCPQRFPRRVGVPAKRPL